MNTQQNSSDLSDKHSTPSIPYTPFDTLTSKNALTYHVIQSGYSAFNPLGVAAGGILHTVGLYRRPPSILASMGSLGIASGALGILVGLGGLSSISKKGEKATPKWNEDGISQRVEGLRTNFNVRVIDVSTWIGAGLSVVALVGARGPTGLRLSPGFMGVMQAVGLGTALGSVGAIGCILATTPKEDNEEG